MLITITLLAFIVLLLVGLAAYTRIETAVAGNTQRMAQARENAMLGLQVALGQVQKFAGPDQRATATSQALPNNTGTARWTGVWSASAADAAPLTWLVSGNELSIPDTTEGAAPGTLVPAPLAITPDGTLPATVDLVGRNSTGSATRNANYVAAPLMPVTAKGVPGAPAAADTLVGRYAWWVGDQGVKAPVAAPDTSSANTFAPYDSPELRARVRQQLALGAGAANAADGAPFFEPRDSNNTNLVANQKVTLASQIAFLRTAGNAQVGLARVQQNFHAWSPNNFAVLANAKDGGLRQDLSLAPGALGAAFVAWANYDPARGGYMEKFLPDPPPTEAGTGADAGEGGDAGSVAVTADVPPITPAYGTDPVRRRYRLTPPLVADGAVQSVAPVLSFFGMSFSVRESETAAPNMEVAARCVFSLWNPYSSALAPEPLRIEVTGLPDIRIDYSSGGHSHVDLQRIFGGSTEAVRFQLPWVVDDTAVDKNSWLPGRVYSWAALENLAEAPEGIPMSFHTPDATPQVGGGKGVLRQTSVVHPAAPIGGAAVTRTLRSDGHTTIQVRIVRASDDTELATYNLNVEGFGPTTAQGIDNQLSDFAIIRRFPETDEIASGTAEKWLTATGRDPRNPVFPANGFIGGANGEDPAVYGAISPAFAVRSAQRLLDRAGTSYSYNEDVPVFELPRAPLLSLGQLQHLQLVDVRPFAIGNPWGATAELNGMQTATLFDRFFFSGLVDGVTPDKTTTGDLRFPNPLLRPLRKRDGTKVTIDEIREMANPPSTTDSDGNVIPGPPGTAFSSKYLLQAGAFNVNSVNAAAWAAVLRGVRFPAPQAFTYLDALESTGTADDAAAASLSSTDAQFFRFPQSAQETYKAEPGKADNDAEVVSPANTHLFRRGMRTLTGAQVSALAAKIAELVGVKLAAGESGGGPFRSLEEFLSPTALFAAAGTDADGNPISGAPRSLLEAAIADAGINADIPEFSSQWLTQADVMTALAPVLFTRSDTFVIRSYGEAVNPATTSVEGRAWCEAIVQRLPEYFDPSLGPESPPSAFAPTVDPNDPEATPVTTEAQRLNQAFGRRFKIVSFRWLTRSDI